MSVVKFQCRLLSDIVINQKAATEGNQETLDFIPGSNFLGIVASKIYSALKEDSLTVFHSGKVRFGDAHPAFGGFRTLRIPACMYYPKVAKMKGGVYIHHNIDDFNSVKELQLKQCRDGFYNFSAQKITQAKVNKSFAIKSAYDKEKRRSKDEQMYGYQFLDKGSLFYFEVDFDKSISDFLKESVVKSLLGINRVGRSRTAQFGLVDISEFNYIDELSNKNSNQDYVTVYADSRLIFLDEYGLPSFQPTAQQLGFVDGTICWSKSQIRTFQYAPWNFKRQVRDADRCGIEKGSVFIVKTSVVPSESQYIGSYINEGFGKVLYNPSFLDSDKCTGLSSLSYQESVTQCSDRIKSTNSSSSKLITYLLNRKKAEKAEQRVLELINDFVEANFKIFENDSFASQWGTIRSIAMKSSTTDEIRTYLFDKVKKNAKGEDIADAYLTHGVAKDKWQERNRIGKLEKFINDVDKIIKEMGVNISQKALINLASEMAKKRNNHD